jgi:hypothetical protein
MSEQVKTVLPESLMKAIELVTESDLPAPQRLEAAVLICHGWGLWQQHVVQPEEHFSPTSYAIPERQWMEIAEWLQGTKRSDPNQPLTREEADSIAKVNLALSFMNSGPSGYKEA